MDKLERAKRLKEMMARIAPGNSIESVSRPARGLGPTTGLEGLESVLDSDSTIESALEKLADDREQELTQGEMFGLEAIILPKNRPVVFVRGQAYEDVSEPWLSLNSPDAKAHIGALLPMIGRIEVPNSAQIPYAGTGFIVGPELLMTNRHVARLFSEGLGLNINYHAGDSAVDFKRQIDSGDDDRTSYLEVVGVELVHPFWDMALLRVDGLPAGKTLKLSTTPPESMAGRNIVAIGYPAQDPRSDLALQNKIFGGVYNVKRLQPGVLGGRTVVRSFENQVNAVTHDASTLGGNSGSAIIDLDTGDVVALHFAGEYLKANYGVPTFELARDSRLVKKQLNFTSSVPPTGDYDPAWARTESPRVSATAPVANLAGNSSVPVAQHQSPAPLATKTSTPEPPVAHSFMPTNTTSITTATPSEGHVSTWTIPIHISISIGSATPALSPAVQITPAQAEEAVVVNQDYRDRPGYDPDFLDGVSVPLPVLSEIQKKDTAQVKTEDRKRKDDSFELTYFHYSVYMNAKRRHAWFSAANVDGKKRPAIGARSGDKWYIDPRIGRDEQLGQEGYESGIDRGHLTRREDTAWGDDVASATASNNDTFHFTNCSLQASPFNRGKDRWQGLEQFLLEQHAKKDKRRMTVITGPVFATTDPVYQNDKMKFSVRCPLQFWKVCVLVREDGTPSATAFILGQDDIKDLPGFEETFDVAATQIKVADLEKRTGLKFGDLKKIDHFAKTGETGTLETIESPSGETHQVKVIRGVADIVI